ncbi:MAG: hypothetical protein JO173_09350 [Gammaproteobacteria bacterium]|nr:hypothetical protein [Gammaproteobacteria bacterium]
MANSLKVTLNKNNVPWTVEVPNTSLNANPEEPQAIKWHTEENAAGATFVGFAWSDPNNSPPGGIFGQFDIITGTKWATLSDMHKDGSTAGRLPWPYCLWIKLNGTTYGTPGAPPHRSTARGEKKSSTPRDPPTTTSSPNIKNN